MKKLLIFVLLLTASCQGQENAPTQNIKPSNFNHLDSVRVDHYDVHVVQDKVRNVTCWVAMSNARIDTGSAIWCSKDVISTKE